MELKLKEDDVRKRVSRGRYSKTIFSKKILKTLSFLGIKPEVYILQLITKTFIMSHKIDKEIECQY